MQFNNIIGQSSVKHILLEMVAAGRLPHAQMLIGSPGSGKLALALAFAQYALCLDPGLNDSCGACRNCTRVSKLLHPDLHFVYPVVGNKITSAHYAKEWRSIIADSPYFDVNQWLQYIGAENKQGNINKDECLQIVKKLSLKSFESSHKILIIWRPEFLGKEGNRLLKIIEEPPENTLFIFVAENQDLILNTILSRCQLVKVNRLSDEEIEKALKNRQSLPEETARAIAHLADGNFTRALSLAEKRQSDRADLFLDWMRRCYKGNGVSLVKWVEKFASLGRENQKHFFQYALHFIREYMHLKIGGDIRLRLQAKELETAKNLVTVIDFDQILAITALFDECSYNIERNANPKVLLLDASIKINQILKQRALVK